MSQRQRNQRQRTFKAQNTDRSRVLPAGARYIRKPGQRPRLKKLGITPGSDISWGA